MAQEMPKRMFSASDDALLSRAVNMQQAAVTYQTQLADYGFTGAMITALDTAIEEAIVFPSDDMKLLEIVETTQIMEEKEEALREAIRAIVTRAILVWGEKSVKVGHFRAEGLIKTNT
jgi:predicted nucleotidyltransferase